MKNKGDCRFLRMLINRRNALGDDGGTLGLSALGAGIRDKDLDVDVDADVDIDIGVDATDGNAG